MLQLLIACTVLRKMAMIRTFLSALQYPKELTFNHKDEHQFRSLVTWLENVKVRHYPLEARTPLGDVVRSSWPDAFAKYMQDLECPIVLTASNRLAVLEWLLSFAVSLEYADHADQYNAAASSAGGLLKGQHSFPDLHSPEVQEQLRTLLQLLHVDVTKGSLADQLQAAVDILQDSVLPSLVETSEQRNSTQDFPLGFDTGDPKVDAVAMVLRMLYIKDLRQLQTAIDGMLVQIQEYTANPRTDASLGKVGH